MKQRRVFQGDPFQYDRDHRFVPNAAWSELLETFGLKGLDHQPLLARHFFPARIGQPVTIGWRAIHAFGSDGRTHTAVSRDFEECTPVFVSGIDRESGRIDYLFGHLAPEHEPVVAYGWEIAKAIKAFDKTHGDLRTVALRTGMTAIFEWNRAVDHFGIPTGRESVLTIEAASKKVDILAELDADGCLSVVKLTRGDGQYLAELLDLSSHLHVNAAKDPSVTIDGRKQLTIDFEL